MAAYVLKWMAGLTLLGGLISLGAFFLDPPTFDPERHGVLGFAGPLLVGLVGAFGYKMGQGDTVGSFRVMFLAVGAALGIQLYSGFAVSDLALQKVAAAEVRWRGAQEANASRASEPRVRAFLTEEYAQYIRAEAEYRAERARAQAGERLASSNRDAPAVAIWLVFVAWFGFGIFAPRHLYEELL